MRLLLVFILLIAGCSPVKKEEPQAALGSFPVQFMAQVDNSQDGCGTVLCASEGFCVFPQGIPQEELTEGSIFWVQGSLSTKGESQIVNSCMGMVKNVLNVESYIRHSSL